jgi:nucleoside-diphosphate-sugar epimerase
MKIAITGGAGFLGRRLAGLLLQDPTVEHIVLADAVAATGLESFPRLSAQRGDISSRAAADAVVAGADIIFHLAAVVSGSAEADFDLGMRVNLDGTRTLLEAARSGGRKPIFVFASSLAVFGSAAGSVVGDDTPVQPLSSYGIQKAIGELLVSDYTRKAFVDGRVVRLPTVCVRPGRPNGAASSFVSGIIREPLNGERFSCPVEPGLELWLSSPGTAIENDVIPPIRAA